MSGPKSIYLARRRADLDRDGFIARWRQHGALGIAQPRWVNVLTYQHADVVQAVATDSDETGDGVGMIRFRSDTHRDAHVADTASQGRMVADERETFADLIRTRLTICRERTVIDGPETQYLVVRFVWRGPHERHADFVERWMADIAGRTHAVGLATSRLVVDLPIEEPGDVGLGCDLVEEWWIDDIARAGEVIAGTAVGSANLALVCEVHELFAAT